MVIGVPDVPDGTALPKSTKELQNRLTTDVLLVKYGALLLQLPLTNLPLSFAVE
jgi:hypothetical protein